MIDDRRFRAGAGRFGLEHVLAQLKAGDEARVAAVHAQGLLVLARREGVRLPDLDEVACAAIILAAEAYVHDYARRGEIERVPERAPAVQELARALFVHGVTVADW